MTKAEEFYKTHENEIEAILSLLDRDIAARDAWVDIREDEVAILLPDTFDDLRDFISEWKPLCPPDTDARIKKFVRAMKRRNFWHGYGLNQDMIDLMVARFVAGIKMQWCAQKYKLIAELHKLGKYDFMGYTYLDEIVFIIKEILSYTATAKAYVGTVQCYDSLRSKY